MNEKLANWSRIAEIVSAAAVLVTLVFLIVGIQENTATTRVSVYGDLMAKITDLEAIGLENPELGPVLQTFYQETTATLTADELQLVHRYAGILFRNYEQALFARDYDVIVDDQWERFERLICLNSRRASLAGLNLIEADYLTLRFKEYIEDSCS